MEAQAVQEKSGVRGFFRLQITEDDKVVGDSGWNENQVVNLGFHHYLCFVMAASAGSKVISHMALGTGTAPGAAATALDGELAQNNTERAAITAATSSSSKTVRFLATFASGSLVSVNANIANVGLFNTSAVTVGTLFAGNTFASSTVASNQNVNATWTQSSVEWLVTVIKQLRKFGETLFETTPSQALCAA